jgi:beta-lactamase class A
MVPVASRLIAFLFGVAVLGAQPAAAASSPQLVSLEQQITALARVQPTELGIAAFDMASNESICINCEAAFPMASTVKVAVAAAYLSQVDFGRRSLDQMIGGRRASSLIEAMLIHSDNGATDVLIRNLGGPSTIDEWLRFHELTGIRVDRTIYQLLVAKRDLWDVRDSSTPTAMIELLKKINTGNVLKTGSHAYLLNLMGRCMTGKNRIRGLLPTSVRVENKTGTLSGLTTDVGFITMPDGRKVAVAIFARGGSGRPRAIAEAARAIYYGFASLPRERSYASVMGQQRAAYR